MDDHSISPDSTFAAFLRWRAGARGRCVHEATQRHVDAGEISGAVTLVARRGRIVHFEAHGLMDMEAKRPMEKDALFRLASMTKPITGTAVLMMMEEGKLRQTDPVWISAGIIGDLLPPH